MTTPDPLRAALRVPLVPSQRTLSRGVLQVMTTPDPLRAALERYLDNLQAIRPYGYLTPDEEQLATLAANTAPLDAAWREAEAALRALAVRLAKERDQG